jgi:tetratricopeptide (TPR) repeat protein
MLFDLKGKRKRLIQVVYVALAVLFAVGLVGFGVGGATSGGLLDAISGGGSGGSGSSTFEKQVTKLEQAVAAQPRNEKAWAQLARTEYQVATTGGDFDNQTGAFGEDALRHLRRSARAWERYLKLEPRKPDAAVASLMVQVYGSLLQSGGGVDAIGALKQAARAQEIVAEARPSAIAFFNLASIQYLTGKIAAGDQSAKEAVKRTPKDQRNTVQAQVDEIRKRGLKIKSQTKKADEQAAAAAKEARKSGQDPFGATPGSQVAPNQ